MMMQWRHHARVLQLHETAAEIADVLRVELGITETADTKLDEVDDDDAFRAFDEMATQEEDETMQRVEENLSESLQNTVMWSTRQYKWSSAPCVDEECLLTIFLEYRKYFGTCVIVLSEALNWIMVR